MDEFTNVIGSTNGAVDLYPEYAFQRKFSSLTAKDSLVRTVIDSIRDDEHNTFATVNEYYNADFNGFYFIFDFIFNFF